MKAGRLVRRLLQISDKRWWGFINCAGSREGEGWLHAGYILKAKPKGFVDVVRETKKKKEKKWIKDSKIWELIY